MRLKHPVSGSIVHADGELAEKLQRQGFTAVDATPAKTTPTRRTRKKTEEA